MGTYNKMLYLVSYGILCHCDNFPNDTSYEQVHKYRHPNLVFVWYILHPFFFLFFGNGISSSIITLLIGVCMFMLALRI